jgi:1-acyl-sn-glycerol-3-phosphate acyltransferase
MIHPVTLLRSLIFGLVFYMITVPWVMFALLLSPLGQRPVIAVSVGWSRLHRLCARWLAGQRVVVEGILPPGPVFFVLKHESLFETIDLPAMFDRPAIAAKRELMDIPLWGRVGRAYGLLPVDREAGAAALRQLRTEALAVIASGRSLCLFPEGTRIAPGACPPLKSGFAGLYMMLRLPVVPVAVSSGQLNPRGGLIRRPGIIRYRVGNTIPAGLDRREAEARVHAAINAFNREDGTR